MLQTYDVQQTTSCLRGTRIVVLGDSTARQFYYSMVKKVLPDASTEGDRHSNIHFQDPASGTTFEFYWDPVLNSTKTLSLLSGSGDRVLGREVQTPSIFLVGTGLWFLRYSEWSGGIEQWKQLMKKLIRQMDSPRLEPLAQNLFISPIPAVNTEKLSMERLRTLLPKDIKDMNNFLKEATKESSISVPFSWNKMTETAASETNDGLHYAEAVVSMEADILLNFVCNKKLPKVAPMHTTCCYDYPSNHWFQTLMLAVFLVWLPAGYIIQSGYRQHASSRLFPSLAIIKSLIVVAAAVVYIYFADRTSLFFKGNKVFTWTSFSSLIILSVLAGFITLKKSEKDQAVLSRDQTDEWKGWMQIVILIYHYTGASSVSAIYNPVRMLVASYLFMTGFGHFVFYYKKADFGFSRVASILTRLNLLTILLAYTMNTTYLAYYFAPLVSFFYLIIYGMMYIGHSHNHKPLFIVSKILITAVTTVSAINTPSVLDKAFALLHFVFGVAWSAKEWRFRLQLDVWIVFVGALFAYGFIKAQEISITTHPRWNTIQEITITASIIGLAGYFLFEVSMQKFEYNHWHPYISWIPILSFVVLRNSTAPLRNTVSTFYTFIGKCSLETFICQFHIWLAGDTKGILIILPWAEGTVAWNLNLVLSTFLFITIAHVLSGATAEVADWLITGREPKPKGQSALPTTFAKLNTSLVSTERENGVSTPVTIKRQSVPVSPISTSVGTVGPYNLKSLMEASLEMETTSIKSDAEIYNQEGEDKPHYKGVVDSEQCPTNSSPVIVDNSPHARRTEGVVLQIDTNNASRFRSGGAMDSARSPSGVTLKSIWAQPIWKITIFLTVIWLLNYGST
ncbi:hypothetical protein BGZ65_004702 [Modicella reniformis]|uniref:Cas1p 10 TM acyl transferase domain-containing protein n=1 Tax=Modicella reniformis TaxID=1440133 RepID=A0A9P6STN1_9FUNG|nr:hypothetical protein BGZ65_004702 [Modicella reniformis]